MSGIIAQNTLDGSGLIKSPEGGGAWNFIKKISGSGTSTISFVDGTDDVVLDSTYKTYVFTFKNIHSSGDGNINFEVNFSTDTGSNYDATKTSAHWYPYHGEGGAGGALYYASQTGFDCAQETSVQVISTEMGNANDENVSGYMYLFDPSNTTFVKHFMSVVQGITHHEYCKNQTVAGYCNTTSAVDAVQFSVNSGNIDLGDICLYGIST